VPVELVTVRVIDKEKIDARLTLDIIVRLVLVKTIVTCCASSRVYLENKIKSYLSYLDFPPKIE